MTIQEKIDILKSYSLFKDLSNHELEEIATNAEEKKFPPKTIMISQNNPSPGVYLIYKGLINIYIINIEGRIIPIRSRGPMYIVGEINIIDDESTATIETIQETHTLMFTIPYCSKLLEKPKFTLNLLKIIVEKLRVANRQTEYQITTPLKDRTWDILQALSLHFPNKNITLSQEELALIIGATRARITEVLNELEKQNLITLSHRNIHVLK